MTWIRFLFRKIFHIAIFASTLLTWWSYTATKDRAENLKQSFANQENTRVLAQLNLQIQRTYATLAVAVALNDAVLFSQALSDFRKTLESVNNASLIDREPINDALPTLTGLENRLIKTSEAFLAGSPPTRGELKNLLNTIETIRFELSKSETNLWNGFLVSQNEIVNTQRVEKLNSSIAQVMVSFMLIFLMVSSFRREQAERMVRASEGLYRLLFASLAEGILLCMSDGRITFCNERAGKLLGVHPQKIPGNKFTDFYPTVYKQEGGYFDPEDAPIAKAAKSKTPIENVIMGIERSNGSIRWLSVNSQPVSDPDLADSLSIVISLNDVSQRVFDQQVIANQQDLMAKSAKLSALGEMAGGVAHEINNPLAVIHASAEELLEIAGDEDSVSKEDVAQATGAIMKTVDRISRIVRGLRTFARDGASDPFESCSVLSLVTDAAEVSGPKLSKSHVRIDRSEIPAELHIECRIAQLEQVLVNLISNSADAIESLDEKWIRLDVTDLGEAVRFSVTDSGKGIPKAVQDKLFQPFFTTKKVGKGTGLGMSISKGIVDSHNGKIYIDNECKNTRFVVEIPKVHSTSSRLPEAA